MKSPTLNFFSLGQWCQAPTSIQPQVTCKLRGSVRLTFHLSTDIHASYAIAGMQNRHYTDDTKLNIQAPQGRYLHVSTTRGRAAGGYLQLYLHIPLDSLPVPSLLAPKPPPPPRPHQLSPSQPTRLFFATNHGNRWPTFPKS